MSIEFTDATRTAQKLRLALDGPSGAGKTFTGLALGTYLAAQEGGPLAVIDTERGSSEKYQGENGWDFKITKPQSFSPASLTETLGVAAGQGFPVVFVDSWSHYWSGVDGMLEQVDRRKSGGNNFSGWKEARPEERRMVDALVSYPGHVIVSLRVKTEYVVDTDDRGKKVPRKIGLRPEQRENFEYEFDVVGDLDLHNVLTIGKTRCSLLRGQTIQEPGPELAATLLDWLNDGAEARTGPMEYREQALAEDATYQGLLDLHAQVTAAGLLNAPVTDEHGNAALLGALIARIGTALRPPKDQPTQLPTRDKAQEPAA